ncbi:membrane hypothetical protein [Hyella patelloides LEGE 07179]|uniref:Uncharacterized protein n=1 Tax=Hyella patelloides LEGE 07179 TaxID=945734 RepID=A0A563VQE7_9CYAN|nr:hypothetical protein [Hyella patelloides]VEP13487.1 membrane hypothetical protein [Hyella patelloides LEGE 07179]
MTSTITDALLSLFLLSTSYSITFALISIISAPLYYKDKSSNRTIKNNKEASNLYKYLNPKSNQKSVTINEFALYLDEQYNLLELKFQEEDLKKDIEEHESSRNIAIIPLSILLFLLFLWYFQFILGMSTKDIIDNFPDYFGIGFSVLCTTIVNFALKLALFNSVKFKKQALSAIRKAQTLITET